MTRIEEKLYQLKTKGKKTFIAYLTAGYPDLETTRALILELEARGVDVIELGIPFSDPLADGPVIQKSSQWALEKGVSSTKVLQLVREVRQKTEVPLVLMGYYNPIFKFGEAKFVDISSDAGVDGLIVVDLPPEEAGQLKAEAERNKLNLIFLLTPVSSEERIKLVCEWSSGFIYCVSYTGVTGGGEKEEEALANLVRKIRTLTATSVEIGFGISSPQDAKKASRVADGIIVGSAIIKEIASHTSSDNLVGRVGQMVEKLVRATKR